MKIHFSVKFIKAVEYVLIVTFGFQFFRKLLPEYIPQMEWLMPIIDPLSIALYYVYSFVITGVFWVVALIILCLAIGSIEKGILDKVVKDASSDNKEWPKFPNKIRSVWGIIEDVIMVYLLWALGKRYLPVMICLVAIESRWFISLLKELVERAKVIINAQTLIDGEEPKE